MSIPLVATSRGFYLGEFTDEHGRTCSIQESSLATASAIWLGLGGHRMHLTQQHVADLLPLLNRFLEWGDFGPDTPPKNGDTE